MVNTNFRYESSAHEKLLDFKYICNKRCGYNIYKDMYIIPIMENGKSGGLYTREGNLISETSTNKDFDCETVTLEDIDSYDHIASPCIYLGVYEKVWGHFITDCLKKYGFSKACIIPSINHTNYYFFQMKCMNWVPAREEFLSC